MKRKSANELLVDTFRELAETKNVDKITIKDITDHCGCSGATFYRQCRSVFPYRRPGFIYRIYAGNQFQLF